MSHFTKIKTAMRDREALAAALRDLYPNAIVNVRDRLTLSGYRGRTETAEVAVRTVGAFGTDIGYARQPDGTLARVADDYTERHEEHQEAARRLPQRYAYHQTINEARRLGFRIMNETTTTIAAPLVQRAGR